MHYVIIFLYRGSNLACVSVNLNSKISSTRYEQHTSRKDASNRSEMEKRRKDARATQGAFKINSTSALYL